MCVSLWRHILTRSAMGQLELALGTVATRAGGV